MKFTGTELLFFELLRVSLGTQDGLSRQPSVSEWFRIREMAISQSVAGVCYSGLIRLRGKGVEPPEEESDKWLGIAAQIQMRNKIVDGQCSILQRKFAEQGVLSAILKGQGLATLYPISELRQPGDIDILVDMPIDKALAFASSIVPVKVYGMKDIRLDVFRDTMVEMHIKPAILRNPKQHKVFMRWYDGAKTKYLRNEVLLSNNNSIIVPNLDFNIVYLLVHKFHHLLSEGINLKQIVDYFYVLQHMNGKTGNHMSTIEELKLQKFTSGIMWIMKEICGMDERLLLCKPSEKYGSIMLEDMLRNEAKSLVSKGKRSAVRIVYDVVCHNIKFLPYFPEEVIWEPIFRLKHAIRKKLL